MSKPASTTSSVTNALACMVLDIGRIACCFSRQTVHRIVPKCPTVRVAHKSSTHPSILTMLCTLVMLSACACVTDVMTFILLHNRFVL